MKKIIIGVISLMFTLTVNADSRIEKQETKKFPTMKQCVDWLDSRFPNKAWHKQNGRLWELLEDSPREVTGITTTVISNNLKQIQPVAFSCEFKQTGTEGTFYKGSYMVLKAK
ncbi:hypothetical protein J537_0570 [Acinetobacter baumannii 1437282]|nr:hypothetical protein J537_0570 [Acinetobacter baumannii 1437282]